MQYNQPFCVIGYGGPNCGQCYSYSPSQYGIYPEIIGEGEVTSVLFPDGSIQFYFIPILNKRSPSFMQNPTPYCNFSGTTNTGVWFIKNFSNPIPPALFQQFCRGANGEPFLKSYYKSDYNINTSPFLLKFHNDNWTSTTDIHYFYPCLRECNWFTTPRAIESTAVQVDISVQRKCNCGHAVARNKLCHCYYNCSCSTKSIKTKSIDCCNTLKKECNNSQMSIVQSKSGDFIYSKNEKPTALREKSSYSSTHGDKKNRTKKNFQISCECDYTHKPNSIDKSVTTYADQASSCESAKGCETQTKQCVPPTTVKKINSVHNNKNSTEIWLPKTPLSQKKMKIKSSENIIGIYESSCNSDTCICSSDTDE
ncbi:uncharacterized protein LOC131843283 [Achroia grisella]|uniref:uncharacterized protein LOC131843283 n=1 Tax=Achroia grisella TaxID=688607 RepID=UPI0027D2DFA3|nr:uncharacterized protein LOC131843283 [Achroia grisella]